MKHTRAQEKDPPELPLDRLARQAVQGARAAMRGKRPAFVDAAVRAPYARPCSGTIWSCGSTSPHTIVPWGPGESRACRRSGGASPRAAIDSS